MKADWQPAETAPPCLAVLVYHPDWDTFEVAIRCDSPQVWQQSNGDLLRVPTHWTALPLPPGTILEPPVRAE